MSDMQPGEGSPKPIAKVIDNNQPGWTSIIETAPNVTLDIGTNLYDKAVFMPLLRECEAALAFAESYRDITRARDGERITAALTSLRVALKAIKEAQS